MTSLTPAQKKARALMLATTLAIPAEGIRYVYYYDPPGILTVCRGHTGKDIDKNKVYSLKECDAFLTDDMRKAVNITYACVPDAPVPVLAAFSDAVYNMGPKIACDKTNSTAARLLAVGKWRQACDQLLRWDKATVRGVLVALKGLITRRHADHEVCISEM